MHAYDFSFLEAEAEETGVEGHTWLHSEFETSLGYLRPSLKKFLKSYLKKKNNLRPCFKKYSVCMIILLSLFIGTKIATLGVFSHWAIQENFIVFYFLQHCAT